MSAGNDFSKNVAIERVTPEYPITPPFHPHVRYPEYSGPLSNTANEVYDGVRRLFVNLGLDKEHFGTAAWNPLGDLIRPGQQVLIKPSIVLDRNLGGGAHNAVVTHGSLVRVVADYALKALAGTGRLVIGDAPVQQCDFTVANARSGVQAVVDHYADTGVRVDLVDFRFVVSNKSLTGVRSAGTGDPAGFTFVNLGEHSMHRTDAANAERFTPTHYDTADRFDRLRVTNYDPSFMRRHHNKDKHEYIIATTALQSDVVISLPKLKTHRKVGLTVCLKNLIGINGHKDCLPHHMRGSREEGGDEYLHRSALKRLFTTLQEFEDVQTSPVVRFIIKFPKRATYLLARRFARDPYFEGSWWGNDTLWRTVLDINRILLFWNKTDGRLETTPQRVFFSIVDGVVAGEKEGPLEPSSNRAGLLMAGMSATAVDYVCARLVGFNWTKLPLLTNAFKYVSRFSPEEIIVSSEDTQVAVDALPRVADFVAPKGWQGHIERDV